MNKFDVTFTWSTEHSRVQNKDKVIIANNGRFIKISKECLDIIDQAVNENLTQAQLLKAFADQNDAQYFEKLLTKMNDLEVFDFLGIEKSEKRLNNIYIIITDRCNLKCMHCSMNARNNISGKDYLNTSELLEILDKSIALNPKHLILTGGEPLIREDIYEILQYVKKSYKGLVTLMTNGLLINTNNINKIISYVDNIDISIDGIDEETCAAVRGKNVFNNVIDRVKLLQEFEFNNITLSMVFGKNNYHLLDEFKKLNKRLQTSPIPRIFTPVGRGEVNQGYFMNDVSKAIKNDKYEVEDESENLTTCNCGAVKNSLSIDYRGNIYPCSLLMKDKYLLGNIKDIFSLKEWYNNREYIKKNGYDNFLGLLPQNYQKCKECNVNLFCWKCLEAADRASESVEQWEERCRSNKDYFQKIVWNKKN